MKILIGVVAALVIALGVTGYALHSSWQAQGELKEQLTEVRAQLDQSEADKKRLAGRFDTLDQALSGLNARLQTNQADLRQRLTTIQTITQEKGDDPKSISCLDIRVPAQLSRGVQ